MQQKIRVSENGRTRKVTVQEGLLLAQRNSGLKGNLKAAAYLLKEYAAHGAEAAREANREVIPQITKDMTAQEAADIYARMIRNPDAIFEE